MKIGGLLPFSTIDFPGHLSAVVFCQGCPWRCNYCHNPHLLAAKGETEIAWEEVLRFLSTRRGLLDALVFSGGEPTMQPGLQDAIMAARGMGFKLGLHTAGPYPNRLMDCLPWLDWVGMDIKAPFEEYEAITGVPDSGNAARRSAELVRKSGVRHRFRTTLDPWANRKGHIEGLTSMVTAWGDELEIQKIDR